MTEAELKDLVAKAVARYEAMSPEEKADHDYAQRRSFVRGQCPSARNYDEWCESVDKILPPKRTSEYPRG